MTSPVAIGWKERVSLPAWGVENLEAKADTGAKSSAIDVKSLIFLDEWTVQFEVVHSRVDRNQTTPVTAKLKRHTRVKSSNGHITQRVVVETEMQLGPVIKTIDISLICRKRMQCRMLIGRSALADDFLINASAVYLASMAPVKRKRKRIKKKLQLPPLDEA